MRCAWSPHCDREEVGLATFPFYKSCWDHWTNKDVMPSHLSIQSVCLSMYQPIYQPIYEMVNWISIKLCICLFVYLSTYKSGDLLIHICSYLYILPFLSLSLSLSPHIYIYIYTYIYIYMYICLFIYYVIDHLSTYVSVYLPSPMHLSIYVAICVFICIQQMSWAWPRTSSLKEMGLAYRRDGDCHHTKQWMPTTHSSLALVLFLLHDHLTAVRRGETGHPHLTRITGVAKADKMGCQPFSLSHLSVYLLI